MPKQPKMIPMPGLKAAMKAANIVPAELARRIGVEAHKTGRWVRNQRVRSDCALAIEKAVGKELVRDRSMLPTVLMTGQNRAPIVHEVAMEDIEKAAQELRDTVKGVMTETEAGHRVLVGALDRFLATAVPDPVKRAVYRETLLEMSNDAGTGDGRRSSNGDGDAH